MSTFWKLSACAFTASLLVWLGACSCKKNPQTGADECSVDFSSTPSCVNDGNNISGHIYFTNMNGVQMVPGARIIVEISTDGFVSRTRTATIKNDQGFTIIPYDTCVPVNRGVQVRAFQSDQLGNNWVVGESNGRYDQTSNGHGPYVSIEVPQATAKDWNKLGAVDISLDSTATQ